METNVEQIIAMIPADSMFIVPTTMISIYLLKGIHPKLKENAQLLAIIISLWLSVTMIPNVPLLNRILIWFALAVSSMKAHDITKSLGNSVLQSVDVNPDLDVFGWGASEEDAVYDDPDLRDWKYEEMFWSTTAQSSVFCNGTPMLNQWALAKTKMACTRFGIVKSINEMNYLDNDNSRLDPVKEWDIALSKYWASLTKWATLQSSHKQMKNQWYITWYTLISGPSNTDIQTTKRKIMEAMSQWILLFSWSDRINWVETRKTWYAVIGSSTGHAFAFTWYNGEWVLVPNSYGDRPHGSIKPLWYFIIRWEDIGSLFSIYWLLDKKQIKKVDDMKVKVWQEDEIINQAISLWITNWDDLDSPATRRQVITMIMRSLKK